MKNQQVHIVNQLQTILQPKFQGTNYIELKASKTNLESNSNQKFLQPLLLAILIASTAV